MILPTRSDRLKKLRHAKGISQRQLANLLNIPFGTYGGYEHNNNRNLRIDILLKLANFFETTTEYIEKGDSTTSQVTAPLIVLVDGITQEERIALVPVAAQAGYVKNYNETVYLQKLPLFSLPGFSNGTYRMFPVEGDSMIPTFQPGDILICEFVEHWISLKDNECYVVVSTEGICIKRCINAVKKRHAIIIESDNPEYKPDLIPIESILEIWHYKARITKS